jgi:hypothetical protein
MRQKIQKKELEKRKENRKGGEKEQEKKAFLFTWLILSESEILNEKT